MQSGNEYYDMGIIDYNESNILQLHNCIDLVKLMSINTAVTSGDRTFRSVDLLQLLYQLQLVYLSM